MTIVQPKGRLAQALDALRAGDREAARQLIAAELQHGPHEGERWRSVAMLAARIGEIELSLDAAERFSRTRPVTIERLLYFWGELATYGRTARALQDLERLPRTTQDHPAILHFLGTIAGQRGDFAGAEDCYRRALGQTTTLPQTWFALAMIKRFVPGDPDMAAMERLRDTFSRAEPGLYARFLYGLAKAHYDCGDFARAFELYADGAGRRRELVRFDPAALTDQVDRIIATFIPENIRALTPSGERGSRSLFVNGLPRSGTTLVEQILVSHSQVSDGAEINALRQALIPTRDYSLAGALDYQRRAGDDADPWGALARVYDRIVGMWFGQGGLAVDKTLSQSRLMGLLLHMLPDAPILWVRRNPEDAALSCYRSYFSADVAWTWSLTDIGTFFREEDRLFDHWQRHFGDRMLIVPYEGLVRDPETWIPRLLAQCGLAVEPQVFRSHTVDRDVRTASVQQVRAPISPDRIGSAASVTDFLGPFRAAYAR